MNIKLWVSSSQFHRWVETRKQWHWKDNVFKFPKGFRLKYFQHRHFSYVKKMLLPFIFLSDKTGGVSFDRWLANLHIHSTNNNKKRRNLHRYSLRQYYSLNRNENNQYYRLVDSLILPALSIGNCELNDKNMCLLWLLGNDPPPWLFL